ncbi:uncharacterized protein [Clytia hemisphaerica]|uniref:Uncharacterized protein n=1 Tax=Clytia hemisphaerica TaxID=252671 RepID=A0A7M5V9I0_9CNID
MKTPLLLLALLFVVTIRSAYGSWHKYNHGVKNLISGMASMPSSTTKLFGVGRNGHLWERIWSGNSWHWVDHWVPPGMLLSGDKLESTPCVIREGKLFVVSKKGRLWERHWGNGKWNWVFHGRPLNFNNQRVDLDPTKCMASRGNNMDRVFARGTDGEIYQLRSVPGPFGGWSWRAHFRPNGVGIRIVSGGFDVGMTGTHLYAIANNGQLYRFPLSQGTAPSLWENSLGRPSFTNLQSLSVSTRNGVTRVLVVSVRNEVHTWSGNPNTFSVGSRPNGVHSFGQAIILSKEFQHTCSGNTETMVMVRTLQTIYSMTLPGFAFTQVGSTHHLFIDEVPAVLQNPRCPKVFVVTSEGELVEFFV